MEMNVELIQKYYPELTGQQVDVFIKMGELYKEWNQKINLISRNDIDNIYLHHILHSLTLLKFYNFKQHGEILDLGTGGGFPGIPLAVLMTESKFTLIDGTAKKIRVVNDVAEKLNLENVKGIHIRAEEMKMKFDFVFTRAVATIDILQKWSKPLLKPASVGDMPAGIFAYKGGDYKEELKKIPKYEYTEINRIYDKIEEEYFKEKVIIYLQK